MIGDFCMSFEAQRLLQEQIMQSHVRFGSFCLVLGFLISYGIEYLRIWYDGRVKPE